MPRAWPDGFLWGTGASSTQCEGAAPASDWIDWERAGRAPVSGAGNEFATRHREDFALYASAGLVHHRLSIEWARIEPEPGRVDEDEVARYRDVLQAARELGIEPWVCLHHFTVPRWFAAEGGFARAEGHGGAWRRHVERMAERFGDLVAGWKPVNEPAAYAAIGWLGGGCPPGRNDFAEFGAVLENVQRAKFEAARILRDTGRPVATIFNLSTIHPTEAAAESVAKTFDDVIWGSWLSIVNEGVARTPGRAPVDVPDLADAFDLIGFSYYCAMGVTPKGRTVPYPADAPTSPLGYGIWAPGLRGVLDRLHEELPQHRLLISEYGLGTDDDDARCAYLREGLDIVREALDRGIDLRGFFHWTGIDNYEWLHGFDVAFGCIGRDRAPRASQRLLAEEIAAGRA